MRILHVIPAMTWERGGPAAVVAALARHQHDLGHQIAVLTTDQGLRRGEQPIQLPPEIDFIRTKVFGPDRCAFAPRFAAEVQNQLRAADVMHLHSIFRYPCLAAVKAAARVMRPVVIRPCGVLHRYGLQGRSSVIKALFLRRYGPLFKAVGDAWHYTSANEREQSWPWGGVNSFTIANGIDPKEFAIDREAARLAAQDRWPALKGHDYVLFLGRIHAKKRVDLLLEAFLQGAPTGLKLVVAGPDEDRLWPPLVREYLAEPKDASRVIRTGLVTGEDKPQLLAGARLFALASEHENFGNAVLEALAAGTPVVGTANVDLIAELAQKELAYVAEPGLAAWREVLAKVLADEPMSAHWVDSARGYVAEHYSWTQIAEQLTREYQKLV